jgi:hypothetical protein
MRIAFTLGLLLATAAGARADDNAVTFSPLGVIGFTFRNAPGVALGYERVLGAHLAAVAEVDAIHVHGDPTHLWTFGGLVALRWYRAPLADSPFAGAGAQIERGFGRRGDDKLTIGQLGVLAHLGYRWIWPSGFQVTARLGAGVGDTRVEPKVDDDAGRAAAEAAHDVLAFTPVFLDGELSIGWRF